MSLWYESLTYDSGNQLRRNLLRISPKVTRHYRLLRQTKTVRLSTRRIGRQPPSHYWKATTLLWQAIWKTIAETTEAGESGEAEETSCGEFCFRSRRRSRDTTGCFGIVGRCDLDFAESGGDLRGNTAVGNSWL